MAVSRIEIVEDRPGTLQSQCAAGHPSPAASPPVKGAGAAVICEKQKPRRKSAGRYDAERVTIRPNRNPITERRGRALSASTNVMMMVMLHVAMMIVDAPRRRGRALLDDNVLVIDSQSSFDPSDRAADGTTHDRPDWAGNAGAFIPAVSSAAGNALRIRRARRSGQQRGRD